MDPQYKEGRIRVGVSYEEFVESEFRRLRLIQPAKAQSGQAAGMFLDEATSEQYPCISAQILGVIHERTLYHPDREHRPTERYKLYLVEHGTNIKYRLDLYGRLMDEIVHFGKQVGDLWDRSVTIEASNAGTYWLPTFQLMTVKARK